MKYYATKISENIAETPEGYMLVMGVSIGRTGVQDYGRGETPLEVGKDGIVKITREEEEVFRPETIASFEGKPFTIKHPEEFVTPENWKELAKGIMQHVRRGDGDQKDDLVCDLLITDAFTISLVKNGLRGLSCGYEAEYIPTGEGTGKQTNIVGNHLALVEEGRAGSAYEISDHKGVPWMSKKFADKVKSFLGKAIDEASKEDVPAKDESAGYDELVKLCKDLGEKVAAMKPKDEEKKEDKPMDEEEKPEEKKADDEDVESGLEDRLKKLEAAVAKLLEAGASDEEEEKSEDEEEEMVGDEEEEESEDDAMEMTGDTASRAEILSPGIKATKDVKANALKAAYGTKDGKKVIEKLTGGKPPELENKAQVEMLFVAVSELMKSERSEELVSTKRTKVGDFSSVMDSGKMTPEKMNEINAKKYNLN